MILFSGKLDELKFKNRFEMMRTGCVNTNFWLFLELLSKNEKNVQVLGGILKNIGRNL